MSDARCGALSPSPTPSLQSPPTATRITPRGLLADTEAIVTSDRWWAYAHLPLGRRQLCWSHLKRDFAAHAEGLAAEKEFGERGLELCERVFWAWQIYQHTGERRELKRTTAPCSAPTSRPSVRSRQSGRATSAAAVWRATS